MRWRSLTWWSGRRTSTAIADLWSASTTVQDPPIPNLPLETPVGGATPQTLVAGGNTITIEATTATLQAAAALAAGGNAITLSAPISSLLAAASLVAGGQTITLSAPTASLQAAAVMSAGGNAITLSAPASTIAAQATLSAGGQTITMEAPAATIAVGGGGTGPVVMIFFGGD